MKQKKKMIGILAAFTVAAVAAIFLFMECRTKKTSKENGVLQVPDIVCWGDSLTVGVGSIGTNYPETLSNLLTVQLSNYVTESGIAETEKNMLMKEISQLQVTNKGWSGEGATAIAARAGGIYPSLQYDVSFGMFDMKKEIYIAEEDGKKVEPWHGDEAIPVTMGGIAGELTFNLSKFKYYFTRKSIGSKQVIPAGSSIVPLGLEEYEDDITIVFIGQNGGYSDYEDLISLQKSIIPKKIYDEGKYLILGLTSGTKEERQELEQVMEEEYGRNYINLREFLTGDRILEFVPELTEEDRESLVKGEVPQCLRAEEDMVHLNEHGYEMIGNAVFERIMELGFYDEVKDTIVNYGKASTGY